MIRFNQPPRTGKEEKYIREVIDNDKICGDGQFTDMCNRWIVDKTGVAGAYLTTSCTQALEMSALMAGIAPGDEVILPSYTFVSTANAFVLRGAKLVFVDIRPDTNNIDENLIEAAVTERTRAIVPVHYAGVSCEMDRIIEIAEAGDIAVVEDAAQGVMASYKGRALGSMGDFGCYSFHETKNYSMGEGGAILINDPERVEEAEIIREKGTDRSRFLRGQVDKYSWVSIGSSYLPSELNAAYLWPQLQMAEEINEARLTCWSRYYEDLSLLSEAGKIELPVIPDECEHNAHMFYIKLRDIEERTTFIEHMKNNEIMTVFHYVPLHSSKGGQKYGVFHGEDRYTTRESERLVRLPMYYGLTVEDVDRICQCIEDFFKK